jgi:shikimate dehydrogenase
LGSETLVTDIVYAPLKTQLLIDAAARGCALLLMGLGMLLHQAAPGFEAWFGQKPIVDDELRQAVLS